MAISCFSYANKHEINYDLYMKNENLASLLKRSLQKGIYSFKKSEALEMLGCTTPSFINAANRLARKKELTRVGEGFYIITTA